MDIHPELIQRRVAARKADYDFAMRQEMIDKFGVNTVDDLMFLYSQFYMRDQGMIKGPSLVQNVIENPGEAYRQGYLAPLFWTAPVSNEQNGTHSYSHAPYSREMGIPRDRTPDRTRWAGELGTTGDRWGPLGSARVRSGPLGSPGIMW